MARILVGCEKSGVVRRAFRERGHDAWSCDLEAAEDGNEFHYREDVLTVATLGRWDLFIVHPECRYLSNSGTHWIRKVEGRRASLEDAAAFALECWRVPIVRVVLENPVGQLSRRLRIPDQIIQPYEFGDDASKATCIWHTDNLPDLRIDPAKRCAGRMVPTKIGGFIERWANQTDSGQNRLSPSPTRSARRAETYPGIAAAFADTWGPLL